MYPIRSEISIHALRVEGDDARSSRWPTARNFYPRPPGGGRHERIIILSDRAYFYPRPPGGGRPCCILLLSVRFCISIHALRVEGDSKAPEFCIRIIISIHALRVEGDLPLLTPTNIVEPFLSTPSGWRATLCEACHNKMHPISIHALRVEGDNFCLVCSTLSANFYPRPPGGGRLHPFCQKSAQS